MKISELEIKYGIKPDTIRKWVKANKLSIQPTWKKGQAFEIDEEEFLKVKKLYWDDEYRITYKVGYDRTIFENIDTPEKAYWLGFIVADGCLQITDMEKFTGHFSIDIGGTDVAHLEKFSVFVNTQENIIQHTKHDITGNDLVHIQLCGKRILQSLYNLGIRPNKSGKEKWIDTPFPADFIRGCYDGDGYIKKDLHSIGLVGSYDLLKSIQQHFEKELQIKPHKIGEHGSIFRIEYCGKEDKKKIANYLWYDGCISLNRKQELADKIKKIC